MDWKYKHFHQQRAFQAPEAAVLAVARKFVTESLGWSLTDTATGFTAQGSSFAHHAIANFNVQPAAIGTKVTIELAVERASALGFMLFDVGGYYSLQMRKWLDSIQWGLHQELTGTPNPAPSPLVVQAHKPSARIFNGCLMFIVVMFALYVLVTFICAVVGLATGHLYLLGRGGTLEIEGTAGRIVSAAILIGLAWIVWLIARKKK